MSSPPFVKDDGGRAAAGWKGQVDDCAVRAIAIGTGLPYQQVYDELFELNRMANARGRLRGRYTPRDGNTKTTTIHAYMAANGWEWVPVMQIGSGVQMHVAAGELPPGRVILRLSKHLVACIDGTIHDTHDPSRGGTRAVYGYWTPRSTV